VHRFDPAAGSDEALGVGKRVGAAGLSTGGRLAWPSKNGFALRDPDWEHVDRAAVAEHPVRARRPIGVSRGIKLAFEGSPAARQAPSGRSN
jgi:hypothetical protein